MDTHQEDQPQQKRSRANEDTKLANFRISWNLNARLDHYVADRKREERRNINRSEVAEQALDEFLTKRDY